MINNFDKATFDINVRVALNTVYDELAKQVTELLTLIDHMEYVGSYVANELGNSYDLLENRRLMRSFLQRVLSMDLSANMDMSICHGRGGRSVVEIAFKGFPNEQIRASLVTRFYEHHGLSILESIIRALVMRRLSAMDYFCKEGPKESHVAWFNDVVSKHDGSEADLFVNTRVYYAKLFFAIASKVSSMSDILVGDGSVVRPDLIHCVDVMSSLQRTLTNETSYVGDWSLALREYLGRNEETVTKEKIDDFSQILSELEKKVIDFREHLEEIKSRNQTNE